MRKALVIGIDNYPNIPLRCCVNDATEFENIISLNGDGSPNFDVHPTKTVTKKAQLKTLIQELFKGKNEVALLYFSGHGILTQTGGYLVTPDYEHNDYGISMDEILLYANDSQSTNRIIILDCCHSGTFGSPQIAGGASAFINEGVTILTASKNSEASIEINGHGVFTNLLLSALKGGAADVAGNITPGSVYAYIDQALGTWEQRPVFKTNTTRFIALKTIVSPVSKEILRKIVKYFTSPENEFPLNPSYEDTNSKTVEHNVIEPYAIAENVAIFKDLQKLQSVGLVTPVKEQYMYFAAMNSTACKLTPLGLHYWKLIKEKKI